MLFRGKLLPNITAVDIVLLKEDSVPESRSIDYKRKIYDTNTLEAKKEFLADVSSFANADGGFLVFGIEERKGVPIEVVGVPDDTIERDLQRLLQVARSGIEPILHGLTYHRVSVEEGKSVVILGIPKSWYGPHIVWLEKTSNFFSRTSDNKFQLSINEIRSSFLGAEILTTRLQRFRDERLSRILGGESLIPFIGESRLVLHLLPLVSFSNGFQVDLKANQAILRQLTPFKTGSGWGPRWSFDGFVQYTQTNDGLCGSAVTAFRSGALEATDALTLYRRGGEKTLSGAFSVHLIAKVGEYLTVLKDIGITGPIYICLALLNIRDFVLIIPGTNGIDVHPFPQMHLVLPELLIEDVQITDTARLVRPWLDAIWNAAGQRECGYYGPEGDFRAG